MVTLFVEDHAHVNFSKDLVSRRLNLQIGTMYMEQEVYFMDDDIL